MNYVGVGDAHAYLSFYPAASLSKSFYRHPDHFQILSKSVDFPRNGISPEIYLVHQGSLGYLTT